MFTRGESNFGGNNVSFEINFTEKKFLSTSMFRWRFLKKFLDVFLCVCVCDDMKLPYLYLTATNNKEFTGKSSLTSKIAQKVSEGVINVKPGQDSNHKLII